jgi:hypothetical protein
MIDIKELLERYYDGETTLEEEEMIQSYWAENKMQNDNASQLLFADKQAYQQYAPQKKRKNIKPFYWFTISTSVAASLVFLLFMMLYHTSKPTSNKRKGITAQIVVNEQVSGNINDEELALQQAQKALAYVSVQLNKGMAGISHLNKLESSISKIQNEQL